MAVMDMQAQDATTAPVHALRTHLEAERLEQVADIATAYGDTGHVEAGLLGRLAHIQMALMAVREEIGAHAPKLGSGSEQPLP